MVYLIPTYHNPTGLIMPAEARHRVAAVAAAHPDTLFVDDMTLAELPLYDGPRIVPLAAFGPGQAPGPNLVSVGSLVVVEQAAAPQHRGQRVYPRLPVGREGGLAIRTGRHRPEPRLTAHVMNPAHVCDLIFYAERTIVLVPGSGAREPGCCH
jgi:hypothetical protein